MSTKSKILFLKRRDDDRTCKSLYTLPGGKIDNNDLVVAEDTRFCVTSFVAIREVIEEAGILVKGIELMDGFYDRKSSVNGKDYRTYLTKVTQYTGRVVSISGEHKSYKWMSAKEYMKNPFAGTITKKIIEKYVNSL